jgi:hypothetical protein
MCRAKEAKVIKRWDRIKEEDFRVVRVFRGEFSPHLCVSAVKKSEDEDEEEDEED